MTMMRILALVGLLCLSACSTNQDTTPAVTEERITKDAPDTYTVARGDTLFSICWRYGLDQHTVMKNNGMLNPNKIYVGQKLYLKSAASRHAKSTRGREASSTQVASLKNAAPFVRKADWVWPLRGSIVSRFSAGKVGSNGIRISGKANQTINAAEGGVVAYGGSDLKGYGKVIIIKHRDGLLSAYGFLSKTYVKEGQTVKKRQKIGTVGYSPDNRLMLHFEVRRNGHPVNPLSYIGREYHF